MSYLGNEPAEAYSPVAKDTFSGNNSTTDFTLSIPATTNSVNVYVENVQQEPTTAYTISGTTLSFTAAPTTGTNNIYVIHRGPAVQQIVPPAGVALNPSDVTATGNLSVAGTSTLTGNVSASGNLAVTGTTTLTDDLNVDSGTLFVDASTNRVGIGTSSPGAKLEVAGAGFVAANISGDSTNETQLRFLSNTAARIAQQANQPLIFDTNATERMRIDSSGRTQIGTTAAENGNTQLTIHQSGIGSNGIWSHGSSTSDGGGKFVATTANTTAVGTHFFFDAAYNWPTSFARAFAVRGDGVIFALNTTVQALSDGRLKENIVDATDGLDVITALRPVRFDWKAETGIDKTNQLGFIAQEVEQVFPDAVDIYSNNDDPENPYKSVGAGALIPVLVKAIQEQQEQINELKAEVATLKGN